jgi:sugar O-acyltransferase (sialic acid O-acetyltransferase NeuD family)
MKDLVIIGAGGFGREVLWIARSINKVQPKWNILGFIDSNPKLKGQLVDDIPVLGDTEWFKQNDKDINIVCGVGNTKVRKKLIEEVSKYRNISFATLIHPSVIVAEDAKIGEGSIISAGTIVSINANIRKHVIINLSCTIGHDSITGDYCTINPGVNISGNVTLQPCVDVGTGSQIIQGLEIGEGTVIGAGSVVIRDLPANCTAVGIPAKTIKFHP